MKVAQFILTTLASLGIMAGLIWVIVILLQALFKDVTLDSLAEDAGRGAATIERAFEKGRSDQRQGVSPDG